MGGCALAIRVGGVEVASLWGGQAKPGKPWVEETMTVLMSCSKALVSLIAAKFVSEGILELDVPVSKYWPEFAQAGKAEITVRQLMSHHGGLSALDESLTRADVLNWDRMIEVLARSKPIFSPDGPHQYHAATFGWLVGEVLRRVSGQSLADLVQSQLSKPLGAEAWIGIIANRLDAVAELALSPENPAPPAIDSEHWSGVKRYEMLAMTLGAAFPYASITPNTGFNDPEVQMASIGGAGGISSAKSLAKIWSAAADAEPEKLVNQEVINDMTRPQSTGDPAIHMDPPYPAWGTGFMLNSEARMFLTENSFGHDGYGGQVTFADREYKVGFAFITNDIQTANDNRANELVLALRDILGN